MTAYTKYVFNKKELGINIPKELIVGKFKDILFKFKTNNDELWKYSTISKDVFLHTEQDIVSYFMRNQESKKLKVKIISYLNDKRI